MLHHHARLREGPQVKELLTGRRTAVVCVGALGRGLRELYGFTEAPGRMFRQRPLRYWTNLGSSVCLALDPSTPPSPYRTGGCFHARTLVQG